MNRYVTLQAALSTLHHLDKWMEGHNGFIAGGVFKDIYTNKQPKDIDLFFRSEDDYLQARSYFSKNAPVYSRVYIGENAVGYDHLESGVRIELICSRFGSPEEIIREIDFTVAKFAYFKTESSDGEIFAIVRHHLYFDHLYEKKLIIEHELLDPVNTFERAFRYKGYGFDLDRASKKLLIEQLQGANSDKLRTDFTASV